MESKKLNQQSIEVKKFNIPIENSFEIEKGYTYAISMLVDIVDKHLPDNFDGTEDWKWIARPTGVFKVMDEYKKKIFAKVDKTKSSVKLRYQIQEDNDTDMESDDYYRYIMRLFRHFYPEIKQFVLKLKEQEDRNA